MVLLLAKEPANTFENAILFWVVRVIFAWYLKYRRKGIRVGVNPMPYAFRNLGCVNYEIKLSEGCGHGDNIRVD